MKTGPQLFNQAELNRDVIYKGAAELSDKEINVIRDVLNSGRSYFPEALKILMACSRKAIEMKTGSVNSRLSDEEYLMTMIKDYFTICGSKSE